MTAAKSPDEPSASVQIDTILGGLADWRGTRLAHLRAVIRNAEGGIVEEVKWKKPSNPAGVAVWSHGGIICIGEALKSAVRLTFPKGALLNDSKRLFNARLDSNSIRAIDFHQGDAIDEAALKELVLDGVRVNASRTSRR